MQILTDQSFLDNHKTEYVAIIKSRIQAIPIFQFFFLKLLLKLTFIIGMLFRSIMLLDATNY